MRDFTRNISSSQDIESSPLAHAARAHACITALYEMTEGASFGFERISQSTRSACSTAGAPACPADLAHVLMSAL